MSSLSARIVCFWPGLVGAWHRGNTTDLACAVAAAWSLAILLLATFVWPQWLSALVVRGLWLLAFCTWVTTSARNHWHFSRLLQVRKPLEPNDIFIQAQSDYLAGNWFEAEAKLLEILKNFPRDAESQLLLAGVLRHTRRYRPALRRLAHLDTLDSAAFWHFEIARERELIELGLNASDSEEATSEPADVETITPLPPNAHSV